MPGGGEFTDPLAYSGAWGVVAVVLVLLVLAWWAAVAWATRDRSASRQPRRLRLWRARRAHLRELDRIATAVSAGESTPRQAHQAVSATVRSFATAVGPVDARRLNLEQLREAAPRVAGVVEISYPPAFQPDEDEGAPDRLDVVVREARTLIGELGR